MARLLWQQRQAIGPTARTYAGMTFVSSKGRSLLFGGYTDGSPSFLSDTWEWDGEEWVQVADTGPTPRVPMLTYDSARNVVVLFGGTGEDGDSSIRGSGTVRPGRRSRTKGPRRPGSPPTSCTTQRGR
jgi:kelch motif-containing protein